MDYQLYDNSNILLNSDGSMDNNDEYFDWNPLKINEDHAENGQVSNVRQTRKRKLPSIEASPSKIKQAPSYKAVQDPLAIDEKHNQKKAPAQNGAVRMPTWQVEDITELNGDIDSSLSLSSDLAGNSYNVSDAILSISGLTVFKQEAPSPTNNDVTTLQIVRQNRQSPTSTQQVVHNGTIDETSNQNMINNTINQLLNQSAYTNLQNAIDANLVSSPNSQDNYNVTSTNYNFAEDCRFQYVLAAATSIATKVNEDTLTYLNQGQSYEIKLKKLGDLSMYRGKSLKVPRRLDSLLIGFVSILCVAVRYPYVFP
jgi:hypothetical protein